MSTSKQDEWLQERLAYWQEKLRLQDWRIAIRWARFWELDSFHAGVAGAQVQGDLHHRHAEIIVLEEGDHEPIGVVQEIDPSYFDIETKIVHELLHLTLKLCDDAVPDEIDKPGSMYEIGQEQHILTVSELLVRLDRK